MVFFDITRTTDNFQSKAKVLFTKSLSKSELTSSNSKSSIVSLQFSVVFLAVHRSIEAWRQNVHLYHFSRHLSLPYSSENLFASQQHIVWRADFSRSPALFVALTPTNLGEDDFSVRSELLISKVNFLLSLLLLLIIWPLFNSYWTCLRILRGSVPKNGPIDFASKNHFSLNSADGKGLVPKY